MSLLRRIGKIVFTWYTKGKRGRSHYVFVVDNCWHPWGLWISSEYYLSKLHLGLNISIKLNKLLINAFVIFSSPHRPFETSFHDCWPEAVKRRRCYNQYHTPSSDLEPSGKEEERPASQQLEARHWGRAQAARYKLDRSSKISPEQRAMAWGRRWPMLHTEPRAFVVILVATCWLLVATSSSSN